MPDNPFIYRTNALNFLLSWLVCVVLLFLLLNELLYLSDIKLLADSLLSNLLLAANCFLFMHTLLYYHPQQNRYLFGLGASAVMAALWLLLDRLMLYHVYSPLEFRLGVDNLLLTRYAYAFLIHSATMFIGYFWNRLREMEHQQKRKEETDAMVKEAELFKLRQQLHPHFLFNSLNSINALIGLQPSEARNMVQRLSDFLRGTIKREDKELISLEEELEHLQLYLDIEKVRFGHRLETDISASEEALAAFIPPLLLQPLMENAIKYGLYGTTGDVHISFTASTNPYYLIISIQNPFDPETQDKNGTGFGLSSVRRRLFLLYTRNDLLEVKKSAAVFTAQLKIPLK